MNTYEDYKQFMIENGCNPLTWKEKTIKEYYKKFTEEEIKEYKKKLNNYLSKRYRIRNKITKWNEIYFVTLTLNNENINKSRRTLEDKIKQIFKNTNYICNEDFGKDNGRLHYHALCDEERDLSLWRYGYSLSIKCKNRKRGELYNYATEKKLASYLTKLANHTIKESSGKIIYGRRKKIKKEENIKSN